MGTLLAACADSGPVLEDDVEYGEVESLATVGSYITSGCSTAVVRGLSVQIAEEVDCMSPNSLVRFSSSSRISFASNAVLPFLHSKAKADLIKVGNNAKLTVNSGYRTVAQQYLLYQWFLGGRCGITAAATPGRSNHESGRAIDLSNWSSRISAMAAQGWSHSVPGDPVHFDHTRSPDNRGQDVRAFQRLWNRNHPGDKIGVDGVYGPQTAARLKKSPATGFSKGAQCKAAERGASILAIAGPDRVAPGARATYVLTVANTHDVEWSADTQLVVAGNSASDLYDTQTWLSPSEVGAIDAAIPAAGEGQISITIAAPVVTEETPAFTAFALVDDGVEVGTIELALTITPHGDEDHSGDAGDGHDHDDEGGFADEDGVEQGGCSAGAGGGAVGGGAAGLLAIAGLAAIRRRRRAVAA